MLDRAGCVRKFGGVCETRLAGASFARDPGAEKAVAALLHFHIDGLSGGEERMILCGSGHGDFVFAFREALKRSSEALLILIV